MDHSYSNTLDLSVSKSHLVDDAVTKLKIAAKRRHLGKTKTSTHGDFKAVLVVALW